jgi:decaprenylphospho-beta-D-erythro-pentofuranosid-2-ulose 2-reductase
MQRSQKCVLILGASSDIGTAVARLYALKGYKIFLAGRQQESIEKLKQDLSIRYQVSVECFLFDATHYRKHRVFFDELPTEPDIVICTFGVLGSQSSAQVNWEECSSILDSNFIGAVSILNIIANRMEARKSGVIVGVSSVAGNRGRQSNYLYGSAKAGFTAYLSGLRNRLHCSNVHVVTVKPGFVATKMTENLKLPPLLTARPEQVAKEVLVAVEKKHDVVYVLPIWQLIMFIIKLIPESVFKKLKL